MMGQRGEERAHQVSCDLFGISFLFDMELGELRCAESRGGGNGLPSIRGMAAEGFRWRFCCQAARPADSKSIHGTTPGK